MYTMIAQLDKTTPELEARRLMKIISIGGAVFIVAISIYSWFALTHLPPQTYLGTTSVGLLTPAKALERFRTQTSPLPELITLKPEGERATISATLTAEQLQLRQEPELALDGFIVAESQAPQRIIQFSRRLLKRNNIDTPIFYNTSALDETITKLASASAIPGHSPSVSLKKSGDASSLMVDSGLLGTELDSTTSASRAAEQLQQRQSIITLPTILTGRVLSAEEIASTEARAAALVGKRLTATAERLTLALNDQQIIALIDPPLRWNDEKLHEVVSSWQKQTGAQPQEPEFEYDKTTLKVTKFTPPRNGRTIQIAQTKTAVLAGLDELAANSEISVVSKELALAETPPATPLASLNNLGISERVGFGDSLYAHSIPNRIHNVGITAKRIDDTIIPPGAEFSFNKTLGDVSAETGYKSAYVIKNGKTELGDGGGVCQVSTTVFRAVMNAGLEVTKRLPHSYRVSYYELDRKPGADATVYAGDVDFRFKNDTPGHILLHTITDDKNTYMYVELYGTSDGRRTEIVEHKTWDARPAPPPQYFPDPTLPPGKLVQIDWAASGIRASITNVIYDKNNKEIRRDVYTSNYKPWSAKYLQGIAP